MCKMYCSCGCGRIIKAGDKIFSFQGTRGEDQAFFFKTKKCLHKWADDVTLEKLFEMDEINCASDYGRLIKRRSD